MRVTGWALGLLLLMRIAAHADTGVLIPMDKQAPDPAILSLTEMQVEITIDNGDARVWMRQVFTNHTYRPQEGITSLLCPAEPPSATLPSGMARCASRRDPGAQAGQGHLSAVEESGHRSGLLEQGERTEDDARRNSIFSVHIVPIPAYGTKRLEIEYHEHIPVAARKSYFLLPSSRTITPAKK